ncbi:MAG: hypothetical protein ABIP39_02880 [Polyangiaceae bacterium]
MRTILGLFIAASATVIGCGSDNTAVVVTPAQANTVADASIAANSLAFGALAIDPAAVVTPVPLAVDPAAQAALNAVNAAPANYTPSGCATATSTGQAVNYTFNNCAGPLGATGINGTFVATFSSMSDGIHVSMISAGLKVGMNTVNMNRQGTFSQNGNSRSFLITGDTGSVNGPAGTINYTNTQGSLTWTAGSTCATYSATENLSLNNAALTVVHSNVMRCGSLCPQSGSVRVVDAGGGSIIITYGGTSTASFTESNGNAGSVSLACGG